ncbi:2'-5' RNA ligase family protein [Cellulomonas fengjieae]|uniref:2'-5' RNA ligase family protein n=1 Tax=Cellulomonas fengjieae TaxID=2819978 RepID=A0ABS3SL29_9CELL|nr:2'-5' RNA ligase family protein [Cellulomonas fengjieae]MBO3086433.1 2'-5' RNA ligase family protein [Cellulomonas fengjieae]MBO3100429.1 2'-5' RNA ligase family protein [Cellulomonas fengjieae]QVI66701.1 2'-5' RNA ligase family protein [Cellulomonas fengjieae]
MRLPQRSGDQVRIGVAITVPEPYASVLHAARARCGDPWAQYIRPHITLLGPTVVEPDEIAQVDEHLAAVARQHAPFVVELRGTGTFRPVSPVVFVQVAEGLAGCVGLERSVRSGVLAQDTHFRYHPHVTVAHEVEDDLLDETSDALAGFGATFVVDSFHSYAHGDDGVWRPSRDFSLTGSPADAEVSAAT